MPRCISAKSRLKPQSAPFFFAFRQSEGAEGGKGATSTCDTPVSAAPSSSPAVVEIVRLCVISSHARPPAVAALALHR